MSVTTITANAFADDAITADKINLANNFAFTGTVTGAAKLINSSRALYTSGTITVNTSSLTDTGFDHTYTGASTSNKLLHIINGNWRKSLAGGHAGGMTIYANDSAISEINSVTGLGEWHQDGATTDIKSGSIHYMSADIASTSAIKYSLYSRGNAFLIQNGSGFPLIWTILEIA